MKDQNNSNEIDDLIDAYVDGQLSEEEADRLSALIEESKEARDRYWELALVHGMLEQGLQTATVKAATGEEPAVLNVKQGGFFQWPRLASAAAGLLIGVFSASVVWAYNVPSGKSSLRETTELLFESFEDPSVSYPERFPKRAGVWHGGLSVMKAEEGLEAMQGQYFAKVSPVPGRKFAYARQILDLSELPEAEEGKLREIEVQASFLGSSNDQPSQFQIRLGVFSASMVWAYKAPSEKGTIRNNTELLFDSFEDPSVSYPERFPKSAGAWYGELSVMKAEKGFEAMRGKHVAKLSPFPGRKFSYARRILDLSELPEAKEGNRREIEVQASFLGSSSDQPSQFQIRLGVFSEEPEAVRPIWNDEALLFDRVLNHVGRNHTTGAGDKEWHKMRASVEIPPHARSLVISLAVADAGKNPSQTDHYLDAVRFRLIETSILPE